MSLKKLLTTAAFALSIVTASPAIADKPEKKDTAISQQENIEGKAGISYGYSELSVNHRTHSTGLSSRISGELRFLFENCSIGGDLEYLHHDLDMIHHDGNINISELEASIEFRQRWNFSGNTMLSVGLGGKHILKNENTLLEKTNTKSNFQRATTGPKISLSYNKPYLDSTLHFSVLFGKRNASYDSIRDIIQEKIKIELTPKAGDFSLPFSLEAYHWMLYKEKIDRHGVLIKLRGTPGYAIHKNIELFFDLVYERQPSGDSTYKRWKTGGGLRGRW